MDEILNVVTAGHVDHGKSTVIGRLLADTQSLPEGKLESIRRKCAQNAKPFEYAFLLDALKDEQAQGITIDSARCFFKTEKRHYILIDAPGHIEFLKNMVTGAARADAALLVVDAHSGVEENTRRHGYFLSMLGSRQGAVLVNKMDLVDYKQSVFESIQAELTEFLSKVSITADAYLPVSGVQGDNIAAPSPNMPWFHGKTLLEQLESFHSGELPTQAAFRMPVQDVYKFTEFGDDRRIIVGQVESGRLRTGDKLIFYPSGKKAMVKTLECFRQQPPEYFEAWQSAGITTDPEIYIRRGELAGKQGEMPPAVCVRLRANIFWLGKDRMQEGKKYLFRYGSAKIPCKIEKIEYVADASSMAGMMRTYVERNEVARCILALDYPAALDTVRAHPAASRFVLVDDYEISGGGIVMERLTDYQFDIRNIRWSAAGDAAENGNRQLLGHDSLVVWMTGRSGSGKTTIAEETRRRLQQAGIVSVILDGDNLRRGLNEDLSFTEEGRMENIRRTAHVARMMAQAGLVVLVTLITPYEKAREKVRTLIPERRLEVYVKADYETCQKRDPKGLYHKAAQGEVPHFQDSHGRFEEPSSPDIILDTVHETEESCVQALFSNILSLCKGDVQHEGSSSAQHL
ncbi:MAG: adenylyl-sulfate kinase [Oscillospiraceae bacterium]|nr:adenylyl-sulfate kinase [Oscillospiraceae bacterium]